MTHSRTLEKLLRKKKGYRNDEWGGNHTFILNDVLYGEMACLFNSDIVDYCNDHYGLNLDMGEEQITPEMTEEEIADLKEDVFSANTDYYIQEIEKFLVNKFGTDQLYAIWLTTKEGVKMYYADDGCFISEYEIPKDALAINDLDEEGILFVTTYPPSQLLLNKERA